MESKFYFDLKKSGIYQALKWSRNPVFRWTRALKIFLSALFFVNVALFLYGFLGMNFSQELNSFFLGTLVIIFSFLCGLKLKIAFFESKVKNPPLDEESFNLAEFLDFDAGLACHRAFKLAKSRKLPEINSSLVLHFLLRESSGLKFVFSRLLLDMGKVKKDLKKEIAADFPKLKPWKENYSQDFQQTIKDALRAARENRHQKAGEGELLASLAENNRFFKKLLNDNSLRVSDVENLIWWLEAEKRKERERKKWWSYENLMKRGTMAKEWTSGYTLLLDEYSSDWTETAKKNGFPEVIGHKDEIAQAEMILSRQEYNNVLLVGEPGVGKRSVIQGITRRSVLGESLPDVNYKRLVELDLPGLLAGVPSRKEFESKLDEIFQEAVSAGNIILIINDFHNFIAVEQGPGKIDISGAVSPYLHLPQFRLIAVSSYEGLHKNIEQNSSVLNLFGKVEVPELSERQTAVILEETALRLEKKYKLFVSYPAIREIISLSERVFPSQPFPKKAVDLLDEVMIFVKKTSRKKTVLPEHVANLIKEKTQIPVGEMDSREKDILLNLENLIHKRIINQDTAVREVSTALRRARSEISLRKGPMGGFLFLGPTGVGKTETSKALAEIYFGSESKMIRLDMSEFQDLRDIPRLLGSPGQEGLLTTKVAEDPFSLILLDEIEKAHPNILNLFLQVLDEGHITDGLGRRISFENSIIIATSNAGYKIILQSLKEKTDWSQVKEKLLDYLFEQGTFRPEFINRFDAVVVFSPLSKENLLKIAGLMLGDLKANLKEKGINLIITPKLEEKIVELGYSPTFGAREMRRVIQNKVENVLASALLSGEVKRGQKIEIDPENFSIVPK